MVKEFIINKALEEALKSDMEQKHGSVIFQKDKIFSYGHNSKQVQTKYLGVRFNTHAEIQALNKLLFLRQTRKLKHYQTYDILIIRLKSNKIVSSSPCKNCLKELVKHNYIKHIYYSDDQGNIQKINNEQSIKVILNKYDLDKLLGKFIQGNIMQIDVFIDFQECL